MKTAVLLGCLASSALNVEMAQAQNSPAEPPSVEGAAPPSSAGPYVLACMRKIPFARLIYLEGAELESYKAYQAGLAQVAADMVREPYPPLARPLIDGDVVVLEGVAWDKSISRATPDNFDINLYKPGTPQACRRGFDEIGKFPVRQR